jgi:hypothetical protein
MALKAEMIRHDSKPALPEDLKISDVSISSSLAKEIPNLILHLEKESIFKLLPFIESDCPVLASQERLWEQILIRDFGPEAISEKNKRLNFFTIYKIYHKCVHDLIGLKIFKDEHFSPEELGKANQIFEEAGGSIGIFSQPLIIRESLIEAAKTIPRRSIILKIVNEFLKTGMDPVGLENAVNKLVNSNLKSYIFYAIAYYYLKEKKDFTSVERLLDLIIPEKRDYLFFELQAILQELVNDYGREGRSEDSKRVLLKLNQLTLPEWASYSCKFDRPLEE